MEFFCTVKFNHFMWPHQFIKIFAYSERFFSRPATIDYTHVFPGHQLYTPLHR